MADQSGEADINWQEREGREEKVARVSGVLRVFLILFFASLCTSIALQQTFFGIVLAFAAYSCWQKKIGPSDAPRTASTALCWSAPAFRL